MYDDLTSLTDSELLDLEERVRAERDARTVIATAAWAADQVAFQYRSAAERSLDPADGPAEWVQPTGAHDAYPNGWHVLRNDKEWVSLIPANVWEPGVSGWREVVREGDDGTPAAPPEWVQPTGAHDAYNSGDRVTFEGMTYTSLINGNTWSPAAYPQGWRAG